MLEDVIYEAVRKVDEDASFTLDFQEFSSRGMIYIATEHIMEVTASLSEFGNILGMTDEFDGEAETTNYEIYFKYTHGPAIFEIYY